MINVTIEEKVVEVVLYDENTLEAQSQRIVAEAKAGEAEASKLAASQFADAAAATVNDFDDIAAGLAGTVDGDRFTVTSAANIIVYKNDSGAEVEIIRLPGRAAYEGSGGADLIGAPGGSVNDALNTRLYTAATLAAAKLININAGGSVEQVFVKDRTSIFKKTTATFPANTEDTYWFADSAGTKWALDLVSPMYGFQLGIKQGTVTGLEQAFNAFAIMAYLNNAAWGSVLKLGNDKTQHTNLTLTFGNTIEGVQNQFGTSQMECASETGEAIHFTNRSGGLKKLEVTATAARKANGGVNDHGVYCAGEDTPLGTSLSRFDFDRLVVKDQPGDGIYGVGQMQYSLFRSIEVTANKGTGFRLDGGEFAGFTNTVITPGLFDITFLNAFDNGGPGFILGNIKQTGTALAYRVEILQFEAVDNAHDPERCPEYDPMAFGADPIQMFSGSTIATVTLAAHPYHKGHYARLAGLTGFGGLTAAQLNQPLIVVDWLSDTTFRVVLPAAANATVTGGGSGGSAAHIVRSQALVSGSTVDIVNSAYADSKYNETTSLHGNTKNANSYPSGGLFLFDIDAANIFNNRFIDLGHGANCDVAGTAVGDVPVSTCQNITFYTPKVLNGRDSKTQFGVIIPRGCNQSQIINMPLVGSTNLNTTGIFGGVYAREPGFEYTYGEQDYICLPDYAAGDWCLNKTPVEYSVSPASTLTVLHQNVSLRGDGDSADFFRSILVPTNSGTGVLPAGLKVMLLNSKAYNQVMDNSGNLTFASGTSLTMAQNRAAEFVSNGVKLCQI